MRSLRPRRSLDRPRASTVFCAATERGTVLAFLKTSPSLPVHMSSEAPLLISSIPFSIPRSLHNMSSSTVAGWFIKDVRWAARGFANTSCEKVGILLDRSPPANLLFLVNMRSPLHDTTSRCVSCIPHYLPITQTEYCRKLLPRISASRSHTPSRIFALHLTIPLFKTQCFERLDGMLVILSRL